MFSSQGQQGSLSFCPMAVEKYCLPAIILITMKIKMNRKKKCILLIVLMNFSICPTQINRSAYYTARNLFKCLQQKWSVIIKNTLEEN